MKVFRRVLLGLALALPTWLLASEGGLQFAFAVVERLSGGLVSVAEVHGRLIGEISLRKLEVIMPAASVRIERADLKLRLSRLLIGRLQAEWARVQTLAVTVHERPARTGERRPLTVLAPVRIAVEDGQVQDFRLRLAHAGRDWVVPQVDFAARWRGQWIVIGRLQADLPEAGLVQLRGRIAIADDLLHFEEFEVSSPSTVHLSGVMALTDQAANELSLRWEKLRWPRAGVLDWLGSPKGALQLEGPWARYAWLMEAQTDAIGMAGQLSAHGHGDLKALGIEELHVRALDGVVNGSGRVEWSPALRTDLDLRWERLNPAVRFAEWPGRLNGGVKLAARWDQQQPHVEFDGGFDDSKLRGFAFALQTRGTTEQKQVTLREFALQSGVSTLNARGALWPRMDLRGDVRSTDFASLWAGLSGKGQATFSAQGTMDTLRFGAHVDAQSVAYRKVRAGTLALDADVGFQGHSEATLKVGKLQAGVMLDELVLTGTGTRQAHEASLSVKGSEGAAVLRFAGGESKGTWSGQLTDATVTPAQDAPWTLEEPATLVARLGQLRLEPACFSGANSRACADLDLKPGAQSIAFRIHQFDLHRLRPWLPADWSIVGTLSGIASMQLVDGELLALKADLEGSAGSIEGGGVKLGYGPGNLHVLPDDGRLEAALHLTPAGGTIDGKVYVTAGGPLLDRPMLGDLKVNLPDLTWLPVLSPEIASAQGSIDADLNVSGTLRGPALDGRLQVAGGRVKLATPGIELTEIEAAFDRGRDAPLNAHLSAKSGDGRFTLDGVVKSMQPKLSGQFKLKGEQVQGFNTPEMHAWISPDLTLVLDGRSAKLTGEVLVPRAEITPRELDAGGVSPSSDQVVVSHDQSAQTSAMLIETDVRVVLGDKVRFDGLGLKTRLEGSIAAHDEPGRPTTGRGELHLVGGRYKAYGQDLQIETGRLIFNGGRITDPAIDLRAYRDLQAEEVRKVGLRARGTLEAPEFSLYADSDKPLSQEEQLSWLVLGRSLQTAPTAGQVSELNSARTSLGLAGGDYLAQQLAPRLGFDEVSIGAKPGETADLARLTIGKYLSPKLFVSYGVGLFQPGHFFRMQYDLSRRFKLVGESGVEQGGDVLYTIER